MMMGMRLIWNSISDVGIYCGMVGFSNGTGIAVLIIMMLWCGYHADNAVDDDDVDGDADDVDVDDIYDDDDDVDSILEGQRVTSKGKDSIGGEKGS